MFCPGKDTEVRRHLAFLGLGLCSHSLPGHSEEPPALPCSPPLTVCWRLKPECLPLEEGECHAVSVASTAYNLTHTFRDPGDYCFSIRAENVISKTHQYHRIQVWPSSK